MDDQENQEFQDQWVNAVLKAYQVGVDQRGLEGPQVLPERRVSVDRKVLKAHLANRVQLGLQAPRDR
jgi:hypothetical protein